MPQMEKVRVGFHLGVFVVALFSCLLVAAAERDEDEKRTDVLQKLVHQLKNDVGYYDGQKILDKWLEKSVRQTKSGEDILQQFLKTVEARFQNITDSLRALRDAILNSTLSSEKNDTDDNTLYCCDVPKTTSRQQQYDKKRGCLFETKSVADQRGGFHFPEPVGIVMKENVAKHPNIKQYYADPNGVMITYPAHRLQYCDDYDPRNRSWYFETTTVHPKDVVLVLDTSLSMEVTNIKGSPLMELVKTGASLVVHTLTSNDRVGVVAFSETAVTPEEHACYKDELAVATPQNKKCINAFIGKLQGKGQTNYVDALKKASLFFKNTDCKEEEAKCATRGKRDRFLLFLSDGMPTVGGNQDDIMRVIKDNLSDVTIMTFGIGKALQDHRNRELLKKMAKVFVEVNCTRQMLNSLSDYYTRANLEPRSNKSDSVVYTLPYYDAGGMGFIMSVCLLVRGAANHEHEGVTCIDVKIRDILHEIINFRQGEISYAFIINGLGRVLYHPLLPTPYKYDDDIGLIDIRALERDPAAKYVIDNMMHGKKGTKTMLSQQTLSRGDDRREGIEVMWVNSTYLWAPIKDTNFSVCIVLKSGEQRTIFLDEPDLNFTYHNFELSELPNSDVCQEYNRVVLKNNSTVQFAPNLFRKPVRYSNCNETGNNVSDIVRYMRNETEDNHVLQDDIRGTVAFTAQVVQNWTVDGWVAFVWRYVATMNGVIRVSPGIHLNKEYDHRKRPWFRKTVANKGLLIFSTPYLDRWGANYVITVSMALCHKTCTLFDTDTPVLAVVGGDVDLYHLYDSLIHELPECQSSASHKCFLIDSSGYIVLHEDLINPVDGKPPVINSIHISVKEPEIARILLEENIFQISGCLDIHKNLQNMYFWQIPKKIKSEFVRPTFRFVPIPGTNVYIIMKQSSVETKPLKNCSYIEGLINKSVSKDHITCDDIRNNGTFLHDCNCTSPSEFNHCKNMLDLYQLSDYWPTCMPGSLTPDMFRINDNLEKDYPACNEIKCDTVSNQSECYRQVGCMWCIQDRDGNDLPSGPHCSNYSQCYYGIFKYPSPYKSPEPHSGPSSRSSSGILVIAVTSSVAAVVVLIAICLLLIRCIRRYKTNNSYQTDTSVLLTNNCPVLEAGMDNPYMLADKPVTLSVQQDEISLEKLKRYSNSTLTSGSIQLLTQKVDALVHRLEHSNLYPSSEDQYTDYAGSSTRPNSMASTSISFPSDSPLSSRVPSSNGHQSVSRANSSLSQMIRASNMLLPPYTGQAPASRIHPTPTERSYPTTRCRSPSECTWPGVCSSRRQSGCREPSEHTCPCSGQLARRRYSYCDQHDGDWADEANVSRQSSFRNRSLRRSSTFRQRRLPERRGSSRQSSFHSRRNSTSAGMGETIRHCLANMFQEIGRPNVPSVVPPGTPVSSPDASEHPLSLIESDASGEPQVVVEIDDEMKEKLN